MRLKTSFILFMFTLELFICVLLFINIKQIEEKIKDIDQRNLIVHEYILNKIGG